MPLLFYDGVGDDEDVPANTMNVDDGENGVEAIAVTVSEHAATDDTTIGDQQLLFLKVRDGRTLDFGSSFRLFPS